MFRPSSIRTAVLGVVVLAFAALGLMISSLAGGSRAAYAQDPEITPWPGCYCEEDGNVYCSGTLAEVNSELCADDLDADTFPDALDLCPDVAGNRGGCPGMECSCDGQTLYCPDGWSWPEHQYCADSDGDSFIDMKDECPTVPGGNSGCPSPVGGYSDVVGLTLGLTAGSTGALLGVAVAALIIGVAGGYVIGRRR